MRLTFSNQFYAPDVSPTAQLCASLAEHRARRGDCVTIVCGRGSYVGTVSPGASQAAVRVRRVWTTRLGKDTKIGRMADWASFYGLACLRCLILPRQDVIVALTTPPYIVLAAVLHKLIHPRTKVVLWNMDCYPEVAEGAGVLRRDGLLSRAFRWMNRMLFHCIDHLICLDHAMARLLLSQYAPKGRELACTVIPNWEPAEFFAEHRHVASWSGPAADSLRGRFVVLYLGNAGYAHDFETLLDAAELLRDRPITFLFVGGGAFRPWIEQEFRRRGLNNAVFTDYVPSKEETQSIMAGAGCALITLKEWAAGVVSPSKLHSNLAMRLPILYVGPQGSNVDECIERFGCGVRCRAGQAEQAASFILKLADDEATRQAYARRARAAFDEAYCDRRTLPQFDQVLDGLVQSSDTPASYGSSHPMNLVASDPTSLTSHS